MKTYKVRTQCEDEAAKEQREYIGSKPLHNCRNKSKVIIKSWSKCKKKNRYRKRIAMVTVLPEKTVKTEMKEMDWAWEEGIPGSERNVATGLSWFSKRFKATERAEFETDPITAHKAAPSCRRSRTDPNRAATIHLLCHLTKERIFHY